jgi:UDPglucose 6-dehydrogenase
MVAHNRSEDRLHFTTEASHAITSSQIVFIAVGTPEGEDGSADLQYVLKVAQTIGQNMNNFKIVVDKSTVPVGTAEKVRAAIAQETDQEFAVVSNPEFLKEGAAINDFLRPDRVVVGVDDERAYKAMSELYEPFTRSGKPVLFMSIPSAELTKYAANAMLATRISFMNEIARLCTLLGANVNEVRRGIGSDSRIGSPFLFPGVGYGGSCFPKDVKAIVQTASEVGYDLKIMRAVEDVNAAQKSLLADMVLGHFDGDVSGKTFAVWGLAFKPKTDDMREAPSLTIIDKLLQAGAQIRATDPVANEAAQRILGDSVTYCEKPMEALEGANALIVVTEWNEYRQPDYDAMAQALSDRVIFDGRNLYDAARLREHDIVYYGIGI